MSAAIGVQYTDTLLTKLPGLERASIAVHGDTGMLHTNVTSSARQYMPFTTGDIVGVLVNRLDDCISFAKNGILMGVALQGLPGRAMFACLGFEGSSASVQSNFGNRPFWCASAMTRCAGRECPIPVFGKVERAVVTETSTLALQVCPVLQAPRSSFIGAPRG